MKTLYNQILPGLFMGGTANDDVVHVGNGGNYRVTARDFDTVVTMYSYANPVDWNVKEYRYGIYDSIIADINLPRLERLVEEAYSSWKNGERVLIRCQAGLNRSGLVTALVLMKDGYSAREAIELIREKRSPEALFNDHYVDWLLAR